VVLWCLATPKLGDREVARAMLAAARASFRPGLLIVADKGYAGREFEDFVRQLGATLVRPDRRGERQRYGKLGWFRQRIESVNDTLKGQLGLEEHGGRTSRGVVVRVAHGCSPSRPASGTTGSSMLQTSARWSPTTTEHSEAII